MKKDRKEVLTLNKIYYDALTAPINPRYILYFILAIVAFSLLYFPYEKAVYSLSTLHNQINMSSIVKAILLPSVNFNSTQNISVIKANLSVNATVYHSISRMLNYLKYFKAFAIYSASSFTSSLLIVFLAVAIETIAVLLTIGKDLGDFLRGYISLILTAIVILITILLPIAIIYGYGISMLPISSAAGVIIALIAIFILIYLLVRLVFAQVYAIVGKDPISAISESFAITKGKWWSVFITLVIPAILIVLLINGIFSILAAIALPVSNVIISIGISYSLIFASVLVTKYLLYIDKQAIKS